MGREGGRGEGPSLAITAIFLGLLMYFGFLSP